MSQTPDQAINRVIDRLKDVLEKGTEAEKEQLVELLEADSAYGALTLVEDAMQERFDQDWMEEEEDQPELQPAILRFPETGTRKKRKAKG